MNKFLNLLRNNLRKEMDEFEAEELQLEKRKLYNDWYIIGFYESYYDMLICDYLESHITEDEAEWLSQFDYLLAYLYEEWLSCDGAMSYKWDDMYDFIHECYRIDKENQHE